MRRLTALSALLLVLTGAVFASSEEKTPIDPDIRARLLSEAVFNQEFQVEFTLPPSKQFADIDSTNFDFTKSSLLMGNPLIESNRIVLTAKSLEVSNFTFPSLTVTVISNGQTNHAVTPAFPVNTQPMKLSNLTAAPIEDIIAYPSFLWLWILLIVFVLAATGYLIYHFWWKKRKASEPSASVYETMTDPYEEVQNSLQQLISKSPDLEHRIFFEDLLSIIRRFIERTYPFPARELSSSEILAEMKAMVKAKPAVKEVLEICRHLFRSCDRVKYARYTPPDGLRDEMLLEIKELIEQTRTLNAPETSEESHAVR